jgi:crossover junction endodeoxyribonuclease RuvC
MSRSRAPSPLPAPEAGAARSPLVLGIDPGLRACGWGMVAGGPSPAFRACGVIRPKSRDSMEKRLLHIHDAVLALLAEHRPSEVAIEDPFVGALAPGSALAIGQARAAAMIASARAGVAVSLYAPAAVKAAVSSYGASDKRQIQTMVRLLLSLDADPEPADAADALAVALCHLSRQRLAAVLAAS